MQANAAAPAFDVNMQADNLIVSQSLRQLLYSALSFSCIIHSNTLHTQVRRHRKVTYDNGTVYEGFVNVATGLADGEGSVTWGPTAGRSSRKTYTGQFTAGRTAERVKFKWTEKRPGQISVGSHAYNGTVEVSSFRDTGQATRPAEIRSNSGLAAPRSVKVFGRAGERLFLLRSVS